MIIHISGIPASGKTTLGEKIEGVYDNKKIIVYDTDNFLNKDYDDNKKWHSEMKKIIDKFISENKGKIIIFVGILINRLPYGAIPYKLNADYKFFIDLPLNILLQRYYARECKIKDKQYWKDLAENYFLVNSSREIIDLYDFEIDWHKKQGYKVLSFDKIFNEVAKIIEKN